MHTKIVFKRVLKGVDFVDVPVFIVNGKEVSKAEFEKVCPTAGFEGGVFMTEQTSKKPKLSDALAVHPKSIKQAIERDRRHGVPTDYAPDGRPIIRSRYHQKQLIKSMGFCNQDGGYGD